MEKQPKLGALNDARELQDLTLLNDTTKLIEVAERHGYGARALRKKLEASIDNSGYTPDDGSRLRRQNVVELARNTEKQKNESRFRKFGKKLIAMTGLAVAGFGLTGGVSNASQEKAPVEHAQEFTSSNQFFEERILASQQQVKTVEQHEKEATEWPVEFQSELENKRYENNFGPAYEGEMTQKAMIGDILDRAQKDPAFLAAMTASCGAIEQGDVDSCTAEYLADFGSRVAAFENLKTVLEDENTDVSYYVSEATFNSTYFKGSFERTVNGKEVSGPAIGYSTNLKVPSWAPDAQKYVVSVENASLSLSMELRPDCGWQYNIVDESEMSGVPQVTHKLQETAPKSNFVATPEASYNTTPEGDERLISSVETPKTTPIEIFVPHTEGEQPAAPTPENTTTPEAPEMTPETPETEVAPEMPEAPEVVTPPTETDTPSLPPIGVANPPKVNLPPLETPSPELPPIGIANPPKVELPPKEETPDEKETPEVTTPPPVETTPPKSIDESKDWTKSREKPEGLNPKDVKVNTNENNRLTNDPKEEGNGTKSKNIDGKGQDPRKEVDIKAPNVEQTKPKSEVKEEKDDTPIYTELKKEYKKREVEKNLKQRDAQVNETRESERKAKEFQEQLKKQRETDAKAEEMKKKMADKEKRDAEYQKLLKQMQEKQAQKEADAKRDAEAKAKQQADTKAKQEAEKPKVNAPSPTEVTESN